VDAKVELGLEVLLFLWRQSRCGSNTLTFWVYLVQLRIAQFPKSCRQ
jgi:hypothetical protein